MPESLRAFDLGTGIKREVSQHCSPSVDSLNKTTTQPTVQMSLCTPKSDVASGLSAHSEEGVIWDSGPLCSLRRLTLVKARETRRDYKAGTFFQAW